jgi:uncharacterized membrane protein YdfJ with MMPL/SSD domain
VKRLIRVLAVAVLVAVILVASISPVLARRAVGGHPMSTEKPCEATAKAQNERGAHFEERPESQVALCWLVFPTHNE